MELKAAGEDMPELREIARGLIDRAKQTDPACKELMDRVDGKVPQALIGDDNEAPINVRTAFEYHIIDPKEAGSSESVPAAPETREV